MQRLVKWSIYLSIMALISLISYTFIGPFFGVDFSADTTQIRIPIRLIDE